MKIKFILEKFYEYIQCELNLIDLNFQFLYQTNYIIKIICLSSLISNK